MRSINRVELLGNLGKDIEMRSTPNGIAVGMFSLATSERWTDKQTQEKKEQTEWHRCVYWRCENLAKYLTKGQPVFLSGKLQTREWTGTDGIKRYSTEIQVLDLILLNRGQGNAPPPPDTPPDTPRSHDITDDDVPF